MITFPHAKINLGLHVVAKTPHAKRQTQNTGRKTSNTAYEGYHEVETILLPVRLHDVLEVVPAGDGKTRLTVTGLPIPPGDKPNLCVQAYELLNTHLGIPDRASANNRLPPVHSYLHKCIPAGAGLGGGSSDAAFMLKLLNEFLEIGLKNNQLATLAEQLGSDCPFFLQQTPMLATGRGNILQPIQIPAIQKHHLAIISPPIHIDTANAYSGIKPRKPRMSLKEIVAQPPDTWQEMLVNDFGEYTFRKHPTTRKIKESLIAHGAVYASLSGSGSSVYGLFPDPPPVHRLKKQFPASQVMAAGMDVF